MGGFPPLQYKVARLALRISFLELGLFLASEGMVNWL